MMIDINYFVRAEETENKKKKQTKKQTDIGIMSLTPH